MRNIMYTLMLAVMLVFTGVSSAEKTATVPNEASASLVDDKGVTVVANAEDTLGVVIPDPVVSVVFYKDAEKKIYQVKDIVDYRFYAKNTGNTDIEGITVVDDMLGPITMSAKTLKPGEEITGSKQMTVTDAMAGTSVKNYAVFKGTADGKPYEINGSAVIEVADFVPEVSLTKKFSKDEAKLGETVQVTLTATNVGKKTGTVSISDPLINGGEKLVLTPDGATEVVLEPGKSTSVVVDYVVSENDLTDITVVE